MELVISGLVIGSLIFATTPPPELLPSEEVVNPLSTLADLYTVVPYLLGILALFAIIRIVTQFVFKKALPKARILANFSFAMGYLFFAALSAAYYGLFQVNWLNVLALSLISAGLYIERKLVGVDG